MQKNNDVVLVVAAHPDDEVLGCGGMMARASRDGASVHVLIMAEGLTSRSATREDTPRENLELHRSRAALAGDILGVRSVECLGLPDQRMDTLPLLEVTHQIEDVIRKLSPTVVYTQHGGDLNMDHQITFRSVMTATRPMEGSSLRALYAYPVASSTEWAFGKFSPVFTPGRFVDITDFLDLKIKAMEIYESELREFPHPRSSRSLRDQAAYWGSMVGMAAAEPFQVIWEKA